MVSKLPVRPRWPQNTPSIWERRGLEPFGDGRHLGGQDEQEHRVGGRRSGGSTRDTECGPFGQLRVTQTVRPSRGGSLSVEAAEPSALPRTSFQALDVDALVPEPGSRILARLLSALKDDAMTAVPS